MKKLSNNFFAYTFQIAAVLLLFANGPLPEKEKNKTVVTVQSFISQKPVVAAGDNTMPEAKPEQTVSHPVQLLYFIHTAYRFR